MRLFVAVEPSEAAREWFASVAVALQAETKGLRWVPPANAHWTLAFLGEQKEDRLEPLKDAMRAATSAHEPFAVALGGLGAFDSWRRARVLWAGLAAGEEPLAALAASLKAELQARRFPVEKRDFSAHLTLARAREPRPLAGLESIALPPAPRMQVERLSLMRSHLSPKGARYEAIWRCPLG